MLLSAVTLALDVEEIVAPQGDPDIHGVTHDSRRVGPGFLFCCLPGATVDGHDFADAAARAGAVALLCERRLDVPIAQIVVRDARRAMAVAAATFWGNPATAMRMVGITGTNGKTTTVSFVRAMLNSSGVETATIGTLSGKLTTPESSDLQEALAGYRDAGFGAVAMEVSSQALVQARVDAITYDVAAFTNLSQDHLELHGTMDAYFEAKAELFRPKRARRAVICVDDDWGARLAGIAEDRGVAVERCSVRDAVVERVELDGTTFRWNGADGRVRLSGRHNLANAVVAANVGVALGLTPQAALDGLATLEDVPGRFEPVVAGQPFAVIVDFAHTPDGIEVALDAARSIADGHGVTIVVGCGGDRDRAKRPLMAAAAERLADHVVLTSDNPRHEDPRAILDEMRVGLRDPEGVVFDVDRASAIRRALGDAQPGDVVLIAGKGHETTQTIGDEALPFDDRVVARRVLNDMGFSG